MFFSLLILFKEDQTAQLSKSLFISPISGSKQHNGLFIPNDSNTVKKSEKERYKMCASHQNWNRVQSFSHSVMERKEGRLFVGISFI